MSSYKSQWKGKTLDERKFVPSEHVSFPLSNPKSKHHPMYDVSFWNVKSFRFLSLMSNINNCRGTQIKCDKIIPIQTKYPTTWKKENYSSLRLSYPSFQNTRKEKKTKSRPAVLKETSKFKLVGMVEMLGNIVGRKGKVETRQNRGNFLSLWSGKL